MSHVFWLSTLLPGFALLQLFWRNGIRGGLLGTLARSFVLSVGLLTPLVACAFVFHFSVRSVGILYLLLLGVSAVAILLVTRWRNIWRSLRASHWVELAVLFAVIAVSIPFSGTDDDGLVHAGRIRYLREVGFTLQDPFSPLPVLDSRYHISTYHALFALNFWLAGGEPLELLAASGWFFRMLAFGAVQVLAGAVFRRRWPGVVAMLATIGVMNVWISNPSPLSGAIFVPVLLAQMLAIIERPGWKGYLGIAISSLAFAGIHVGLWLVIVLSVTPAMVAWSMWKRYHGTPSTPGVLAAAALLPAVPLLWITANQQNYWTQLLDENFNSLVRHLLLFGSWDLALLDPMRFLWLSPVIAVLGLVGMLRKRVQHRDLLLAAIFLTACSYMFFPPFFQLLTKYIPPWLLEKTQSLLQAIAIVVIAGGMAWVLNPVLRTRAARLVFVAVLLCSETALFRSNFSQMLMFHRFAGRMIQETRELADLVRPHLKERVMVAADPERSLMLPAVQLSAVMAAPLPNANPADPELLQRFYDAKELLAPQTSAARCRELVTRHKIQLVIVDVDSDRRGGPGLWEICRLVAQKGKLRLYKVSP